MAPAYSGQHTRGLEFPPPSRGPRRRRSPGRRLQLPRGQHHRAPSGHLRHLNRNPRQAPGLVGPVLGQPMVDVKSTYTVGEELGRGQFGITSVCTHKATGHKFVVVDEMWTSGEKAAATGNLLWLQEMMHITMQLLREEWLFPSENTAPLQRSVPYEW